LVLPHLTRLGKMGESVAPELLNVPVEKVPEISLGQSPVGSVHALSGPRVYCPAKLTPGIATPYALVAETVALQANFLLPAVYIPTDSCRHRVQHCSSMAAARQQHGSSTAAAWQQHSSSMAAAHQQSGRRADAELLSQHRLLLQPPCVRSACRAAPDSMAAAAAASAGLRHIGWLAAATASAGFRLQPHTLVTQPCVSGSHMFTHALCLPGR
jgi:hypothetical protein